MHIKRKAMPVFWPIERTGTKYVAVPLHEQSNSVPLIVFLRNFLKIVKNKKEMRKILNEKKISVNGKSVNEKNYPLLLFDVLSIPSLQKYFRVIMKGKRFSLEEIKEDEANSKIYKIIGKKILKAGKIQINLCGGRNILTEEKIDGGDFAVVDFLKNKIMKKIVLEKGIDIIAIKGKHCGKTGKIKEIVKSGEEEIVIFKTKDEEIRANVNNIYALS